MVVQLPLPCLVCGRHLEPVFALRGRDDQRQPNDAVMCSTPGNYGSTVFDEEINGYRLEFNVCDACLVERADRFRRVRYLTRRTQEVYEPWTPPTA